MLVSFNVLVIIGTNHLKLLPFSEILDARFDPIHQIF